MARYNSKAATANRLTAVMVVFLFSVPIFIVNASSLLPESFYSDL